MRRLIPSVAVLSAGLFALSACGGGDEPAQDSPESAVSATDQSSGSAAEQSSGSEKPIDTDASFGSVDELRAAVTDAGLDCDAGDPIEGEGYKESMSCGDNVWLVVFDDEKQQSDKVAQYDEDGSNYLEGENWVVVAPQEALDKVRG
ncbi:hypothetical protein AB0271_11320 [Kocuria palustris]|uniref:hypothetical protein n=1 Tax=Kocuria palustris TaxID=71999 RepID=UPI00344FE65D